MLAAIRNAFRRKQLPDPDHDEFGLDPKLPAGERLKRLELAHKQTLIERARIMGLQRSQLRAVVFMALLLAGSAFFYGQHLQNNTNAIAHAQKLAAAALDRSNARHEALRAYQIASCKRGNESRAAENRSHRDDYLFDTTLASLLRISLSQPSSPNTKLTPAQQARDLRLVEQFVGHLESYAADKEWRYLIPDCEYAVDHPSTYVLPAPIKFSEQLPPAKALELSTHG